MQISKTKQGDMLICNIKGDIDINSSPEIRKSLDELTTRQEKKIILNLEDVLYVDSSGLATMVEMLKKTKKYGGVLRLSNLADKVKSLFEITKLDKLFEIYDTAEQAKSGFLK